MQKIFLFILTVLLFFTLSTSVYSMENGNISNVDLEQQSMSNKTVTSEPTIQEVYEILLKTKDDKIIFLSKYIDWLIAIAAIAVVLITALFGLQFKKLNEQSNKANRLIKELEESNERIKIVQETIQDILSSKQIENKISDVEEKIRKMQSSLAEWDSFYEAEQKRHRHEHYYTYIETAIKNNFSKRMQGVDKELFEKIVKTWNSWSMLTLAETGIVRQITKIYNKYLQDEDEIVTLL